MQQRSEVKGSGDELPKAAAAARKPPARPHGPRRPAEPVSAAFVECRVSPWSVAAFGVSGACLAEKAVSVSLRMQCVVDLYSYRLGISWVDLGAYPVAFPGLGEAVQVDWRAVKSRVLCPY